MHENIEIISLYNLNYAEVENIIERSFDGEFKTMDDETVCLFDISDYRVGDLRSLIIQSNGTIYYSRKTTQEILDAFSDSLHSLHEATCEVASILGYSQKIPYVIGDRCVVPLDGYSKKPVTWIVATNIAMYDYDVEKFVMNLCTFERTVLKIATSKTVFEKQSERAAEILDIKLTMHKSAIKSYRGTMRNENEMRPCIVADKRKINSYTREETTQYDIGKTMEKNKIDRFANYLIQEGFLLEDDEIDYDF